MATRRASTPVAAAAPVSTHDTILNAIRLLLDASSKTESDPDGAKASVGAALRLLLPIVAPESQGPDDTSGNPDPNKRG